MAEKNCIFCNHKLIEKEILWNYNYFYLEENGEKWIFHTKNLPERVLSFRKEFAKFTGLKELKDWRIMNEEEKRRNMEWVNKTKTIFKIANNYKTLNSKKI